jgi:hypothetical protein
MINYILIFKSEFELYDFLTCYGHNRYKGCCHLPPSVSHLVLGIVILVHGIETSYSPTLHTPRE